MKVRRTILVFILLVMSTALIAEGKPGVHKQSIGMMFQIQGLSLLVDNVTIYDTTAGAGVKFWLLEELALRAIVFFNLNYASATDQTTIRTGLSAGAEYHFIKGVVSPYAGAFGGLEFLSGPLGDGTDFHIGAMVGVELTPLEFLSFFIEYTLLATFQETGTEVDFGLDHAPVFGVIIYLN
jgi:hypothetical protein